MTVRIDQELCIGAGECARLMPGAFALGENRIAYVVDTESADQQFLQLAAETCPAGAIFLYQPVETEGSSERDG